MYVKVWIVNETRLMKKLCKLFVSLKDAYGIYYDHRTNTHSHIETVKEEEAEDDFDDMELLYSSASQQVKQEGVKSQAFYDMDDSIFDAIDAEQDVPTPQPNVADQVHDEAAELVDEAIVIEQPLKISKKDGVEKQAEEKQEQEKRFVPEQQQQHQKKQKLLKRVLHSNQLVISLPFGAQVPQVQFNMQQHQDFSSERNSSAVLLPVAVQLCEEIELNFLLSCNKTSCKNLAKQEEANRFLVSSNFSQSQVIEYPFSSAKRRRVSYEGKGVIHSPFQ